MTRALHVIENNVVLEVAFPEILPRSTKLVVAETSLKLLSLASRPCVERPLQTGCFLSGFQVVQMPAAREVLGLAAGEPDVVEDNHSSLNPDACECSVAVVMRRTMRLRWRGN